MIKKTENLTEEQKKEIRIRLKRINEQLKKISKLLEVSDANGK